MCVDVISDISVLSCHTFKASKPTHFVMQLTSGALHYMESCMLPAACKKSLFFGAACNVWLEKINLGFVLIF